MEYRFIGKNSDWFASIDDIAEEAMMGRDSAIRGIKCLEELGLLRVIREKYSKETGKRSSTNRYKILGSTMNHGDEEEKRTQAAEELRNEIKKQPEQVNKAIETKEEPKKDSNPPEANVPNSGLSDERAGEIALKLYGFGMKEREWLRALGSRSRRQVNLCRGQYMGFLSQDDREYFDDYIDNILKVA